MPLTKESLEAKIKGLRDQQTQLIGNVNAVAGAIQLAEQLLIEISAPEEAIADIPSPRQD